MALLDIRQRSGYLFLAVTFGQLVLISAQVTSRAGVPVLETATFGAFAEVQRVVSSGIVGIRHVWDGYVALRRVRSENQQLRDQLAQSEIELQQQRALAERTRGLERLLDLRDRSDLHMTAAEIIAAGATPDFRTLTIDKGTRAGVRADMAVIAPSGVVGRVVVPSAFAAKVQLLIDRNAAAGAIIERSRAQGVIVGTGDGSLQLSYVSEVADVVVGDLVATSGIDGIYAKGFMIGRVASVEKAGGSYRRIVVQPSVDFSSLEQVLVILTPTPARTAQGSSE